MEARHKFRTVRAERDTYRVPKTFSPVSERQSFTAHAEGPDGMRDSLNWRTDTERLLRTVRPLNEREKEKFNAIR
jgi:hypothetical protein